MTQKTKKIRDFIYLDGDKLYSLYSQLNEGLANQIVQSKLKGEHQTKSQRGDILDGNTIESEFSDLIHSTESKVLHDYMYAKLEEQMKNSITEPKDLTKENYQEELKNTFLVKVMGNAEIADYARLKYILENVNEIAGGISYMQEFAKLGMTTYRAKSIINKIKNKTEQQNLQKYIKKFENIKELADEYNLLQDENQIKYLGFFTELFYLGEIEVIIKAKYNDENGVDFRGILNKDWLRLKPESLRMLYGGVTEFDWTMVGQITFLQNPTKKEPSLFQSNQDDNQNNEEKQKEIEDALKTKPTEEIQKEDTMRDSLLNMARATRDVESAFMLSGITTEVLVMPLAIYRETEIVIS